jgi:hypothetical protein
MATSVAAEHVAILGQGAVAWNSWRAEHRGTSPQLAEASLGETDLAGADLSEADLAGADLFEADLHGTNLKMASLAGADLSSASLGGADLYKADLSGAYLTGADAGGAYLAEANLTGADLRGARLHGANLTDADLTRARLSDAVLSEANLTRAIVNEATLRNVTLDRANVTDLQYRPVSAMRGNYLGIRGIESCFGNAQFVRDAKDQDYLDTLERSIEQTDPPARRRVKRAVFAAWGMIDYGRSLTRLAGYALIVALAFGLIYWLDRELGWGLLDYANSADSALSPFYYSVVTYTTLGFGDIIPESWVGEVVVVAEVIIGYITLGMLLSILANKVARRG